MRRIVPLALMLPLFACAPPPPVTTLPSDMVQGAGDPTRAAIISSAYVFGEPDSIAGRPDLGANAVAQVEHLATVIPYGPRWVQFAPQVGQELMDARQELRAALGIAPDAPPQAVVDALTAASRAWRSGDHGSAEQALRAPLFRNGHDTLLLLADLPPLPRTRTATSLANLEMNWMDHDGRDNQGGGDGGKD